jgi:RNA polymerase sigma-70 factor (ECF subfamily)
LKREREFGRIGDMKELSREKEEKLVEEMLAGKKGAVRRFYNLYKARVEMTVRQKVGKDEDIEEIVQDVFLAAVDSLNLYSGRAKMFSWLCGIIRHEICDYYRRKKIKQVVFSQMPVLEGVWAQVRQGEANWERMNEVIEIKQRVKGVLGRMLPRYARALEMKYIEGWSVEEMARQLGETVKATESVLFRARKEFARLWVEVG